MSAVDFAMEILRLLLRIVSFQQSTDEDGRIISPIPQAKQVQNFLSFACFSMCCIQSLRMGESA
jgi:hypothetical protein